MEGDYNILRNEIMIYKIEGTNFLPIKAGSSKLALNPLPSLPFDFSTVESFFGEDVVEAIGEEDKMYNMH